MKVEKLKAKTQKKKIIIGLATISIFSAGILTFTNAKYKTSESIPIVNGTINYNLADTNLIGVYIKDGDTYTKTDAIPESGYVLNEEESYCKVNNERDDSISLAYNVDTKTLSVTPMTTKGTKCYLYFDEHVPTAGESILANYPTILTRTDFTTAVTNTTTGTIYKSKDSSQYDDYGEVYYFAGNPTDNWVYFGGFYWRIIRINGDGTIRMIYQGTSANTIGESTQIGTSAFNSSYNNNMYVGYMYTSGSVHGLGTSSTIKGVLDNWYSNNLSSYASKIDGNVGFCGDREPSTSSSTSNGLGGTGAFTTYYNAYIRLKANTVPTFKCINSSDLYTTSGSTNGNKALTYPIGLITVDEVSYAGVGYDTSNSSYYLYTNQAYWTISPYYFRNDLAYLFVVHSNGYNGNGIVSTAYGVRPVINLKASVTISSGNGTSNNPYVIS